MVYKRFTKLRWDWRNGDLIISSFNDSDQFKVKQQKMIKGEEKVLYAPLCLRKQDKGSPSAVSK